MMFIGFLAVMGTGLIILETLQYERSVVECFSDGK